MAGCFSKSVGFVSPQWVAGSMVENLSCLRYAHRSVLERNEEEKEEEKRKLPPVREVLLVIFMTAPLVERSPCGNSGKVLCEVRYESVATQCKSWGSCVARLFEFVGALGNCVRKSPAVCAKRNSVEKLGAHSAVSGANVASVSGTAKVKHITQAL